MKLPPYPRTKPSGVEWLGDVPEHWASKRFGCLFRFCSGGTPSTSESELWDGELPWVSSKDMKAIAISDTEDHITEAAVRQSSTCKLPAGSLLMVNRSGILRHSIPAAIITREMAINQDIRGCVPLNGVDSKFIAYLIEGNQPALLALWRQQGATVESLTFESVKTTNLQLPDETEQRAIAAFLDRETGRVDRLVAKKRELIERLKEKRTALISRTVTRGLPPGAIKKYPQIAQIYADEEKRYSKNLRSSASSADLLPENPPLKPSGLEWLGDIPKHWEVCRIATVADKITNGFVGPTRDILVDEGVRYLQSLHIKENKILFHREYYVEPEWSATHRKSVLREGDVLIVQTGDVGQAAVVTKEFEGCNCHALIIVGRKPNKLFGSFLSWFLNSSFGFDELKRIQTGALHPHLNCGLVRDVRFACPPLPEQAAIAAYLDLETAKLDVLIEKVEAVVERLQEYRTALITAAVTGKIDVRAAKQP